MTFNCIGNAEDYVDMLGDKLVSNLFDGTPNNQLVGNLFDRTLKMSPLQLIGVDSTTLRKPTKLDAKRSSPLAIPRPVDGSH